MGTEKVINWWDQKQSHLNYLWSNVQIIKTMPIIPLYGFPLL
jgi:hypothetical protein